MSSGERMRERGGKTMTAGWSVTNPFIQKEKLVILKMNSGAFIKDRNENGNGQNENEVNFFIT